MRIAGTVPHPFFTITGYSMDRWWWVEIEGGPMRQSYKFQKEHYPDWESVRATLTPEWLGRVKGSFDQMYSDWGNHLKELKSK